MSRTVSVSVESTRRQLSTRAARTVQDLTAAALGELRASGYDALTIRNVARRAGVAPATAYTYFASREHLVTEVFWRRLQALPETHIDRRRTATVRVTRVLADLALLVVDEPELATACNAAMLSSDPEVMVLRDRIGADMRRRIVAALGDDADPVVLRTLELVVTGGLVQAGMGHVAYSDLPALLEAVTGLVVGGSR